MKRIISIFLSFLILILLFSVNVVTVFAKEYKQGSFVYTVLSDDTVEISKYKGNEKSVAIPSMIDGKTVSSLGRYAIAGKSEIEEIILPNTLKHISEFAFSDLNSLKSLEIPEGVVEVEDWSISLCTSLEKLTLPESLKKVNSVCEELWALKEIKIGSKVESIDSSILLGTPLYNDENNWENGALYINRCLISVKPNFSGSISIKPNVLTIAKGAFKNCKKTETVSIPKSVKYINEAAFFNCLSLKSIKVSKDNKSFLSSKGVLFNKNKSTLIAYPSGLKTAEYSLPKSVKTVSNYAFMNSKLKKVVLDKNLKTVGDCAFFNCKKLKSVTVPKNVKKIGYEAFGYYESGEEFDVDFLIKGFELKGYQGSAAQKYCLKNEIAFVALDYSAPSVSVKGGNKRISVMYKKVKGAAGYQIKYNSKTAETKKLKKTIKLKKGTYKVKVRAYKIKDGKRIYSPWSKVKNVKIK